MVVVHAQQMDYDYDEGQWDTMKCRRGSKTNKSNCQFWKKSTYDWLVDNPSQDLFGQKPQYYSAVLASIDNDQKRLDLAHGHGGISSPSFSVSLALMTIVHRKGCCCFSACNEWSSSCIDRCSRPYWCQPSRPARTRPSVTLNMRFQGIPTPLHGIAKVSMRKKVF